MQLTTFIILISFSVGVAIILLAFNKIKNKTNKNHKIRILSLQKNWAKEVAQLKIRQERLLQYDFLRHNLDEILIAEPSINLDTHFK
ncbi:MAG: hypothetical protein R3359_02620 [Marinirhabdus sp.]|nr:hypothetical protein [Marinirhabdus sp.]